MKIRDAFVLLMGTNGGLGLVLSEKLLELRARKIYIVARILLP